ncbi:peptidase domain-containing ABC transporter, partial [Runella zeae]|uniref:peptidase domain-containing ABC transporter n=1 Tax=Runella zeae TaxID=94255 RepID=UPI0003F9CD54
MNYQSFHLTQREESDCGAVCLLSVLRSFGGNATLTKIRNLSGTSSTGTTLLGLFQASKKLGLEAQGFETDIAHLKQISSPAILHILKSGHLLHFVICYGYDTAQDAFIVSDPAESRISYIPAHDLDTLWQSKTLLLLSASESVLNEKTPNNYWTKLRWLYGFAAQDLNPLLMAFVLGVVISGLGLSVAIFSQKLVDYILPSKDLFKLSVGAGLLLFLLLIRSLFTYLRQLLLLRQTKYFNVRIIEYFYSTLIGLPKSFFDTRKTGDLIARLNDTSRIQQTISNLFANLALEFVVILVNVIVLFNYHTSVGILSIAWLPLFGWIVYLFNHELIDNQRKTMVTYASNESHYIDTIQGIGTIKVANRETHFASLTKSVYLLFQEARFQLGLVSNRFNISSQLASTLFIVGIIWYSSWLVVHGSLSVGSVMAITQMISMVMASAASVALINIQLQEAQVALERMQEFTTLPSEAALFGGDLEISTFEQLRIEKLNFRFTGRPLLLDSFDMTLKKGEIIGILGESGGGKSTLLQILQGFYNPESGLIKVNDINFESLSLPHWRGLVGVVPQQVKLFNGSLFENILLNTPTEENTEKLIEFFEIHGLTEYFEKFPYGFNTILGETGVNISGGQAQLVALARALYPRPQLLLLDEATASMDNQMEQAVLDLLMRLKPDMGIIFVTHRVESTRVADRLYRIRS